MKAYVKDSVFSSVCEYLVAQPHAQALISHFISQKLKTVNWLFTTGIETFSTSCLIGWENYAVSEAQWLVHEEVTSQ